MYRYFVVVGDPRAPGAEEIGTVADESLINTAPILYRRRETIDEAYDHSVSWRPSDVLSRFERGELPGRLVEIDDDRGTTIRHRLLRENSVARWRLGKQHLGEYQLQVGGVIAVSRDETGEPSGYSPLPHSERHRLSRWLSTAPIAAAARGIVADPFDPTGATTPAHIRTDGAWVWPQSLALLVSRYGIPLDPQFHEHIRQVLYRLPETVAPEVLPRAARLALGAPRDNWGVLPHPVTEPDPTAPSQPPPRPRLEIPIPPCGDWVDVPGALGPPIAIRDQYPTEIGGFAVAVPPPFAATGGTQPTTAPATADHAKLLHYLRGCKVVRPGPRAWCALDDLHGAVVEGEWTTDGLWLISGSLHHYLDEHRIPLPEALVQHIRSREYRPGKVAEPVTAAARAAVDQIVAGRHWLAADWAARSGHPHTWAPDRFPTPVAQELHEAGWYRGRDLAPQVTQFVQAWQAQLAGSAAAAQPEVPQAAIDVLREWANISRPSTGDERDYRTVGFTILPTCGGPDDLEYSVRCAIEFLPAVRAVAASVGQPLFPIASVEGGADRILAIAADQRALLLSERGEVLETHQNLDAALTDFIQRPPEPSERARYLEQMGRSPCEGGRSPQG